MRRAFASTPFVCLAAAAPALAGAAGVEHYSLRADFSTIQNPNGPWAYTVSGNPIPCALHQKNYIPELTGWCCQADWGAAVAQLTSEPTIVWHDALLGDVVIHVSPSHAFPIAARWTAPARGIISVGGRAWDASFAPDRDAGWRLLHNSTVLAERNTIRGTFRDDPEAFFHNNLPAPRAGLAQIAVEAGDTIVFTTYDLSDFGHFMGVDIGIDFDATCRGDTNGDNVVDFIDLNRVLSAFGTMPGNPAFIEGADLNADGVVDFLDLNDVLSFFGQVC